MIEMFIEGYPYSKQSFRFRRNGHHYQAKNVTQWQAKIAKDVGEVWDKLPTKKKLSVKLVFCYSRDVADVDNLSKAVLDGLQGIVFKNDKQVVHLESTKIVVKEPLGVYIKIEEDKCIQKLFHQIFKTN